MSENKFLSKLVLGQYFNLAGIKMFGSALFRNRHNFIPHVRAKDISEIDFVKLHSYGVRFIVFDKDNTLTNPY